MKHKIKKQHFVVAGMVIALGAAVFMNWQFGSGSVLSSKELGQAEYVNNESTADSVSSLTTEQQNYFAEVMTERQEAQDKTKVLAESVVKATTNTDKAKKTAVKQLNKLEDTITNQTNIESLIKAKGFSECLCFISNNSCDLVVPKGEMSQNSAVIIKDIVNEQSEIQYENITIIQI